MFGGVPPANALSLAEEAGADEMKSVTVVVNGYSPPDLGQGPQVPCSRVRGWRPDPICLRLRRSKKTGALTAACTV